MSQHHLNTEHGHEGNKYSKFNTGADGDKYKKPTGTLEAIDKAIFESYFRLISNHSTYNNDVALDEPINVTNDARNDRDLCSTVTSGIGKTTAVDSAISDHDETFNDAGVKIDIDTAEVNSEEKVRTVQNGFIESISGQHLYEGLVEKHNGSRGEIHTDEGIDHNLLSTYYTVNNTMPDTKETEVSYNEMNVEFNSSDIKVKTEMTEDGLKCKLCGELFQNLYHLSKHKRTHLGIDRPYSCQLCEKKFADSGGLRKHLRTHTGAKPYKCNVCSKHFTQAHNLKRHILIHTGEQPIQCLICLQQFTCASNAKRHIKLKHTNEVDLTDEVNVETMLETLIKRTPAKSNKLKDNSMASKVEVPEEVSEERYMGTRKRLGRQGRICMICDREFSRTSHLRDHMFTHTGERPFVCQICGHATTVKSALDKHLRVHSGERPYACDVCEKRFTCASDMHTHQQQVHSSDKAFQCGLCNTQFAKSYMLTRHMQGCQREERSFRCDICDKSFKTDSYLSTHKRKHSLVSWSCKICDKQFLTRADLTKHLQVQHLLSKEDIQQLLNAESTLLHQLGEDNSKQNHHGDSTFNQQSDEESPEVADKCDTALIQQFGEENQNLTDECDLAFIPQINGDNLGQERILHPAMINDSQQENIDESMLNQC